MASLDPAKGRIERLAAEIGERGWASVASVLLRFTQPVGVIIGHGLLMLAPLAPQGVRGVLADWASVFERPDQVECLLASLDAQYTSRPPRIAREE